MHDVLGIILGGGQGKRLYPLTKYRSKPAVPLGGKYRLIDIPISNCINSNIKKIFVLTQFNSASLNRHINFAYKFDSFHEGFVDILAAEQTVENTDWFQGTSDAVRKNFRHFRRYNSKDYLILAGDHIYRMDYSKMLELHRKNDADVTVGVNPVSRDMVPELGILKISPSCRIVDFKEKPQDPAMIDSLRSPERILRACGISHPEKLYLASMGIYLFKNKVLEEALSDRKLTDFGKEVIPRLVTTGRVFGYIFNGYWEDIGTIDSFYQANINLTATNPVFDFFSNKQPIYTHARFLPASRMNGVKTIQSIFCEGSIIDRAEIRSSIIGLRSIVCEGAMIQDSILMGADYYQTDEELEEDLRLGMPHVGVGKNSRIIKAIIDKNARIGENVKIGPHAPEENQTGPGFMVKQGITVIEKDALIPDGAEI